MEGLKPEPGVSRGFSSAQWPTSPIGGGGGSQVAGAEALRVGSKLALFRKCVLLHLPALALSCR